MKQLVVNFDSFFNVQELAIWLDMLTLRIWKKKEYSRTIKNDEKSLTDSKHLKQQLNTQVKDRRRLKKTTERQLLVFKPILTMPAIV